MDDPYINCPNIVDGKLVKIMEDDGSTVELRLGRKKRTLSLEAWLK